MRFPVDPPPAVGFSEDLYEIQEAAGIRPLRPVGPRSQPPLIVRPRRPPAPPQRQAGEDTRKNEDRRQRDRRQYTQNVLVDTRLGRDRRHERRRPDDPPPPSIDEKA
ncbi:MAG: hypothetical protein HZA59_11875 [Hydrogenophilales bacterium]|nr:hypothetical protein [Hydrogenophilales bacterium]